MKKLKNILIQFAISFTVLWSVFVWYAAWNDVVNDGDSLTHTMWNDLVTQMSTVTWDIPPILKWYHDGLAISNDWWDADHDVQIDAGMATSDDETTYMSLNTSLTKRIDASWSEWSNQWGLDTGTVSNNTFYYSYLIYNYTSSTVDVLFSASATSPTMPAGYTKKRRLSNGAFFTDGSANILEFNKSWKYHYFSDKIADHETIPIPTSGVFSTYQLSMPRIDNIVGIIYAGQQYTGVGVVGITVAFRRTGTTGTHLLHSKATSGYDALFAQGFVDMNSNAQVDVAFFYVAPTNNFIIHTQGWIDNN